MRLRHDIRVGMLLMVLGLLVLSPMAKAKGETPHSSVPHSNFLLTVERDHISLKADEASLEAILAAMGKQMHMEILGEIPKREPITTDFDGLSLAEAMHHLGLNYGYQLDSSGDPSTRNKLFILPRRTQTALSHPQTVTIEPKKEPVRAIAQVQDERENFNEQKKDKDKPARPAPFQFQFDPSAFSE